MDFKNNQQDMHCNNFRSQSLTGSFRPSSQNFYERKQNQLPDKSVNKNGRIIIRNLSFKVNDEELKKYFEKFGEVCEVHILKLPNGRMKGAAFLQYNNMLAAMKAIKECNMQPFMGRLIAVDLAVPKYKYKEAQDKLKFKEEPTQNEIKIKEEPFDEFPCSSNATEDLEMKSEKHNYDSSDLAVKESQSDEEESDANEESETNFNSDSGMESGDEDVKVNTKESDYDEDYPKAAFAHKAVSKDVVEERTLFLRNFSFDSKEQDIKDMLSQFGELKYVLICRDKITKRFKGSAFAQFMKKEDADTCLESFDDPAYKNLFKMAGRTIFVTRALGREQIQNKPSLPTANKKEKEKKDSRNIYLSREGVIREGTKSAIGVSKRDLALRMQREVIKRKMLANFRIFVSTTRLFIQNLPLELNDKELRNIFRKHSPKDAVIKEARIMRNLQELDKDGIAISRGYGFISFTKHQHALEALRNVNNNPNIFSVKQRPIVEFSMENKAVLKAKADRLQRSKAKLSTKAGVNKQITATGAVVVPKTSLQNANPSERSPFMGSKYDPNKKGLKSLHSHIGPKIRHRARENEGKERGTKITRNKINRQLRNNPRTGKGKTKMTGKGIGNRKEEGMGKRKEKGMGKRKEKGMGKRKEKGMGKRKEKGMGKRREKGVGKSKGKAKISKERFKNKKPKSF